MPRGMIQRFGLGVVLAGVVALLQGCLAAVWVAAVGVGTSVSGSVDFEPFENTWVAPADVWMSVDHMDSVAVTSFEGDTAMATRFSVALRDMSTLRVVDPEQLTEHPAVAGPGEHSTPRAVEPHARLARVIASQAGVHCVLFGTVATGRAQTDKWGNKEVTSHRLKLMLMDARGQVLWKDELPYRVIEGAQSLPEEWIQESLTTHLAAHAQAIGLAGLGFPDDRMQARVSLRPSASKDF